MNPRDRLANIGLLAAAGAAWSLTLLLFVTRSPRGDVAVQVLGAVLLGVALTVTLVPLMWLAAFAAHRRIAYHGDWTRAGRRGMWVGVLAAFFVLLRAQGAFSLPIALFVVALVAFVELTLSVER